MQQFMNSKETLVTEAIDGLDVLKGGEPDGLGHLGAQRSEAGPAPGVDHSRP